MLRRSRIWVSAAKGPWSSRQRGSVSGGTRVKEQSFSRSKSTTASTTTTTNSPQATMRSHVGVALFRALVNNVNAPYVARRPQDGELTAVKPEEIGLGVTGGVREPSHEAKSFTPSQSLQFVEMMGARPTVNTTTTGPSSASSSSKQTPTQDDTLKKTAGCAASDASAVKPRTVGGVSMAAMGRESGLKGFLKTHGAEARLLRDLRRNAMSTQQTKQTASLARELREIVVRLAEISQREMELDNGGGGGGGGGRARRRMGVNFEAGEGGARGDLEKEGGRVANPEKQRYILDQSFQHTIGKLTREHFAAAEVDVLVRLTKICSQSSFVEHTNFALFSSCQVLQQTASSLTHRDLIDVVLAIASCPVVEEGGGGGLAGVAQLYLDWFLEYLIGAERMGANVLGVSSPSADNTTSNSSANNGVNIGSRASSSTEGGRKAASSTSDVLTKYTDKKGREGEETAKLWTLISPKKIHWLLKLMVDRPDAFVYGHCQAFILKILLSVVSRMEPCAVRYSALRANHSVGGDDSARAGHTAGGTAPRGAAEGETGNKAGSGDEEGKSSSTQLLKELKMSQLRNAAMLEKHPISEGMLSTLCEAIIQYRIETVEALDFFIAAAPMCLERAPFMKGTDLANMLLAFVTVGYRDATFFSVLGDEVAKQAEFLPDLAAGKVLAALQKCGLEHDSLTQALESSRRMRQLGAKDLRYSTTE